MTKGSLVATTSSSLASSWCGAAVIHALGRLFVIIEEQAVAGCVLVVVAVPPCVKQLLPDWNERSGRYHLHAFWCT